MDLSASAMLKLTTARSDVSHIWLTQGAVALSLEVRQHFVTSIPILNKRLEYSEFALLFLVELILFLNLDVMSWIPVCTNPLFYGLLYIAPTVGILIIGSDALLRSFNGARFACCVREPYFCVLEPVCFKSFSSRRKKTFTLKCLLRTLQQFLVSFCPSQIPIWRCVGQLL